MPGLSGRTPSPQFRCVLRRLAAGAIATLLVSALGVPARGASPHVTARDLLANPLPYDGQLVTLTGRVTNAHLQVSPRGLASSVFDVDDGTNRIRVVTRTPLACPPGGTVSVEGVFHRDPSGRAAAFSQVEAVSVACR